MLLFYDLMIDSNVKEILVIVETIDLVMYERKCISSCYLFVRSGLVSFLYSSLIIPNDWKMNKSLR